VPDLPRTPLANVRLALKREVGFRCPALDCGRPYLTWHHFNPPWAVEHHHRPEGMIALCVEHAAKADGGAYTKEQLEGMKSRGADAALAIEGIRLDAAKTSRPCRGRLLL
jgi:hypothetical protein